MATGQNGWNINIAEGFSAPVRWALGWSIIFFTVTFPAEKHINFLRFRSEKAGHEKHMRKGNHRRLQYQINIDYYMTICIRSLYHTTDSVGTKCFKSIEILF